MRQISLTEFYKEKQALQHPARQVVDLLVKATRRSEESVRSWLAGRNVPELYIREIIADTLNLDINGLFPDELINKPRKTRKTNLCHDNRTTESQSNLAL
jgi:hypothetical protein